jgi:hypothetical protein
MHSPTGGYCYPKKGYGSDTKKPDGARQQGSQLDQLVVIVEQCPEGPVTEQVIQDFVEKEALAKKQVEVAQDKLEDFKEALPRSE